MAEAGACPICGFERLHAEQDKCPQCDSDLTCFKVLDSIPEESAIPASEHQSSIVSIQREPSIAALEQDLPASAIEAQPESSSVSRTTDSDSASLSKCALEEKIALSLEAPSAKQERKQNASEKTSDVKKRPSPRWPSWNQAAAMLTFAVILIAIVSVFQLYQLRRLESGLKEQTRLKKITSDSEAGKRSPKQTASVQSHLNPPKAASNQVKEKNRPKTAIESAKPSITAKIQKPKLETVTAGMPADTSVSLAKPELLSGSAIEAPSELKPEKTLSEHDFQNHTIKTGDTIKSIAETYYGAAKYYPLVVILNPDMPLDLRDGTGSLKILKDRQKATELYDKNISKIGKRLYFSYTIAKGDTLKIISQKFYRSKKMIKSILDLNPDSQFRPGDRIKIRLE